MENGSEIYTNFEDKISEDIFGEIRKIFIVFKIFRAGNWKFLYLFPDFLN